MVYQRIEGKKRETLVELGDDTLSRDRSSNLNVPAGGVDQTANEITYVRRTMLIRHIRNS